MITSRETLDALLASGEFGLLLGTVENSWFDAKDQPYATATDVGKRALAKDVASFANTDGGVILIGARTARSELHVGDEVVEIRPLKQQLVDITQYRDILADWIVPPVERLEVVWIAKHDENERGVVAIRIPEQPAHLKPFLVAKLVENGRIVETVFGYSERRNDANEPMTVVDLQRTLRAGLNFERNFDERLRAIEALLENLPRERGGGGEDPYKSLYERMLRATEEGDFGGERTLTLAAIPVGTTRELKTVFSARPESIRWKLERPPALRANGWDLTTGRNGEIVRGELVRVKGYAKLLDLYRDGTFVMSCLANDDFLAWTSAEQKLHPLALVELVLNFVNFYVLVLQDLDGSVNEVEFAVLLRNLHANEQKTKLAPGELSSISQMFPHAIREAPGNEYRFVKRIPIAGFDSGAVAFSLLRELYLWFGLEEDKVPYTAASEGGRRRVDWTALARIK